MVADTLSPTLSLSHRPTVTLVASIAIIVVIIDSCSPYGILLAVGSSQKTQQQQWDCRWDQREETNLDVSHLQMCHTNVLFGAPGQGQMLDV
jgi:hypothetical protein